MAAAVIAVIHPGTMGATVIAAAAAGGADVRWASEGRSPETAQRARDAGATDAMSLERLVEGADLVISVVPPGAALEVAAEVARLGAPPGAGYVDANAVAPATAGRVGRIVTDAGFDYVDGGIVGPATASPGSTRLYLAGEAAVVVAELFEGSVLEPVVLDGNVGAASALKMAFAAYTKGTGALLMTIRALAGHYGVDEVLLAEWARSIPELPQRSDRVLERIPAKAWRFVAEMNEIATACADAGLPTGFHQAAAEIFRRVGPPGPTSDPHEVVARLREQA